MKVSAPLIRLLVVCVWCASACHADKARESFVPSGPFARVLVDSVGAVQLNGHSISVAELTDSLRAIKPSGGAVLYSRRPMGDPNPMQAPVMKQVMDAIIGAGLPVRLLSPDSLMLPDAALRR